MKDSADEIRYRMGDRSFVGSFEGFVARISPQEFVLELVRGRDVHLTNKSRTLYAGSVSWVTRGRLPRFRSNAGDADAPLGDNLATYEI